ncbi:hypothetical protein DFH07DRAFT_1068220, partial [Mycena maculata]
MLDIALLNVRQLCSYFIALSLMLALLLYLVPLVASKCLSDTPSNLLSPTLHVHRLSSYPLTWISD